MEDYNILVLGAVRPHSKGAIEGLTRALAAEFAPKLRINCIAPSLTDTPLASNHSCGRRNFKHKCMNLRF